MSKRLFLLVTISLVLALLLTPHVVTAADGVRTDSVRARLGFVNGYIDFTADKVISGQNRRSEIHVVVDLPGMFVNTPMVQLSGDPDLVSVSRDLGWGAIDTSLTIYNTYNGQMHNLEIHITANSTGQPYFYDPNNGFYARSAEISGYLLLDGALWQDFNLPTSDTRWEWGWIASTRSPGTSVRRIVTIQATGAWQDTGFYVRAGQRVQLSTYGLWAHGSLDLYDGYGYTPEYYVSDAVLPSARIGALIGRIDGGDPFYVGTGGWFVAPQAGNWSLSINDVPGWFHDNLGALDVTLQIEPQ